MDFQINDGVTTVSSELFIEPNTRYSGSSKDLVLDGDETCVKLLSLSLNGKDLTEGDDYELAPGKLTLKNPPAGSVLKTVVEIIPEDNTQLSGLYKSGPMYCTQCEAMGFRRITVRLHYTNKFARSHQLLLIHCLYPISVLPRSP